MTTLPIELAYSFSMINLVKFMPEWSWDRFDQVMGLVGTKRIELVPSMLLGIDWDQQIQKEGGPAQRKLDRLMQNYTVGSIQSITYGIQINLAERLTDHPLMLKRLEGLRALGEATGCSVFILGSPGQKKEIRQIGDNCEYRQRFMENCGWIAGTLGPDLILSLEHNTKHQGADYCNTFHEIIDTVSELNRNGIANIGLNLDTKCLLLEFGPNAHISDILDDLEVTKTIKSIQVDFDFLTRDVPHRTRDIQKLIDFACKQKIPLSLEEFGISEDRIVQFSGAWCSLFVSDCDTINQD